MAFKRIKKEMDYHLTEMVSEAGVVLTEGFYRKLIYDDNTSMWLSKTSYRHEFTKVFQESEVKLLDKLQVINVFKS